VAEVHSNQSAASAQSGVARGRTRWDVPDEGERRSAPDWYEVLQVSPTAEREVVEAAYKRLALKYHPDRDSGPGALARMKLINCAYDVLRDPKSRAKYDAERAAAAMDERFRRSTSRAHDSPDQEDGQHGPHPKSAASAPEPARGRGWESITRVVGVAVGMFAIKMCLSHEREQAGADAHLGYGAQQAAPIRNEPLAGWVWYSPPDSSFRISLPHDPAAPQSVESYAPQVGRLTQFSVQAKRASGTVYSVQWSDYPAGSLVNAELALTGARDGAVAAIHGTLGADRALVLGEYPAREYSSTASGFVLRTRMCLVQNTRLIVVTAVVPPGTNEDADVTAFLESFSPSARGLSGVTDSSLRISSGGGRANVRPGQGRSTITR
jgi:curved DNA-binding protein CbpA